MNTIIAFSISAGIFLLVFLFLRIYAKKVSKQFPDLHTLNVLFRERQATGRSHYSFITKLGGANGLLEVEVTDQEVWMKTGIFSILVAKLYKQVHKIPFADLIRVKGISKRELLLHFRDARSKQIGYTLKHRNTEGFILAFPDTVPIK